MLDKVINNHIDDLEKIQEAARADIDIVIDAIDIKELITDAEGTLLQVAENIKAILEEEYIKRAAATGIDLSKTIKKYDKNDKQIIVDDSNNPKLNESVSNDKVND